MFMGAISAEHAAVWEKFLEPVVDKAPASVLCNKKAHACYTKLRQKDADSSAYHRQFLFSFIEDTDSSGWQGAGITHSSSNHQVQVVSHHYRTPFPLVPLWQATAPLTTCWSTLGVVLCRMLGSSAVVQPWPQ